MKIKRREFIFKDCGSFVIEGQEKFVDAVTLMVQKTSDECRSRGMYDHQIIRAFGTMFVSKEFQEKFPQVIMKDMKVVCPEGRLCVN